MASILTIFWRTLVLTLAATAGVARDAPYDAPYDHHSARALLSTPNTGILTFSPNCTASSYVCPSVHPKGSAIALNAVDFATLGRAACGKCIKITAPAQFAGLYPVSNILTQGQSGDIDLTNHPLPTTAQCSQRYQVHWQYDDGPCP